MNYMKNHEKECWESIKLFLAIMAGSTAVYVLYMLIK